MSGNCAIQWFSVGIRQKLSFGIQYKVTDAYLVQNMMHYATIRAVL